MLLSSKAKMGQLATYIESPKCKMIVQPCTLASERVVNGASVKLLPERASG